MTQNKDRKQAIRARMAATGEPYTVAARAISSRSAGADDEFLADRHTDLDVGEDGGAMTGPVGVRQDYSVCPAITRTWSAAGYGLPGFGLGDPLNVTCVPSGS